MLNILVIVLNLFAGETLYVLQLKGKVFDNQTNISIKVGDKITSETALKFTSPDNKLILISNTRARYIISPNPTSKGESIELAKNLIKTLDNSSTKTRAVETTQDKTDLENYFGIGKFFIIGTETTIKIDKEKYQITPTKSFIIRYKNQSTTIDKNVVLNGDLLRMTHEQIFQINGTLVDQEGVKKMDLYMYDSKTKIEDYITSFVLQFIKETQVAEEFDLQIKLFKDQNLPKEDVKKELIDYFSYAYGNTDSDLLANYIDLKLTNY
jgi:hypothetical protein